MSLKKLIHSHFQRLMKIEKALEHELKRPAPDRFRVINLKKMRLLTKDRLARILRRGKLPKQRSHRQPAMARI